MTDDIQPTGERCLPRRTYLATVASALTIGAAGSATAAGTDPPADSPADHVDHITEVRDDLDELRDYAPKLATTQPARDDMQGMYGWTAESDEYDVTAHYYWVRYHTQRSILYYFGWDTNIGDSHHKDHEPIAVFQNPDGTVDSVVFSGGHHYAAELSGMFDNLTEDRVSGRRTHANLQTVRPWNHYVEAPSDEHATDVENYTEFGSWLAKRDVWYKNGRYTDTAVEAIEDPFSFYDDGSGDYRTMWWESGTPDAWVGKHVYNRLVTHDQLRYEE